MKKFLNFLGEGVPPPFLHQIRRVETAADFERVCRECLDHDEPMSLEPGAHCVAACPLSSMGCDTSKSAVS